MTRLNVLLKLSTLFSYSFDHDGPSLDSIIMLVVVNWPRWFLYGFYHIVGCSQLSTFIDHGFLFLLLNCCCFIWSVVSDWIFIFVDWFPLKVEGKCWIFFSWVSMKLWVRKSSTRIGDFQVLLLSLRALMFECWLSSLKDANFKSSLLGRVCI